MGIQGFTKVFETDKEVKYKDLNGKNIAIDASIEIYRAALGMSLSKGLTDSQGNPTSHINTLLLGVILKLKASGANQYWIFDYQVKSNEVHNPLKQLELAKRSKRKQSAKQKLEQLKIEKLNLNEELFSDDEDTGESSTNLVEQHEKLEKQAFDMQEFYREDTIFMLNLLDISWLEVPCGFDAEHVAALATQDSSILNVKVDYVLSQDVDSLLFGACRLLKRDIKKKKLFEYNLQELLSDNNISQDDLIKIGLILGTDFAPKTPRIGPKTVLNKFRKTELSDEQTKALNEVFKKQLSSQQISQLQIHNYPNRPFSDSDKFKNLLDWLELVKNYNRDRIKKQFHKNSLFTNVD